MIGSVRECECTANTAIFVLSMVGLKEFGSAHANWPLTCTCFSFVFIRASSTHVCMSHRWIVKKKMYL